MLRIVCLLTTTAIFAMATHLPAAEIVLRATATCERAVVRLIDIAEVYAATSEVEEALNSVELFPTPPEGTKKFVRAREVLDALALAGVNMSEHRLSGQSQVELRTADAQPVAGNIQLVSMGPSINQSMILPVTEKLQLATIAYLEKHASAHEPWKVEPLVDDELVQAVLARGAKVEVRGGSEPWVGRQTFIVTIHVGSQSSERSFEANVTLPPAVVMAVRPIARGQIIGPDDVTLSHPRLGKIDERLGRLEDVVGREATRMIASGQFLDPAWVKQPIMVRRGDVVSITARSSGLRVHMMGKAKEDGALGDLISVESLLSKETIFTRVTGMQEVEVFARAVDARTHTAAQTAQGGT